MTVVRNEMEAGENNPLGALAQRVMASIYMWHNYGKSTIGARADVENVPIDRLQAFYKKYYQPDNAVVIIAGKFDEAAAVRLLAQKFGPIPKPARTLDRTYTMDPPQDGERAVTVERVGDVQAVFVAYRVPAAVASGFGRRRSCWRRCSRAAPPAACTRRSSRARKPCRSAAAAGRCVKRASRIS